MGSTLIHGYELIEGRHGRFYHLPGDTGIGTSLRAYGEWAEAEIYLASRILKVGDTVVDVGAHIGSHVIPYSKLVGDSGMVVAIEGQPIVFNLLMHNIFMNERKNVVAFNSVLDSETRAGFYGESLIQVSGNTGAVSFGDDATTRGSGRYRFPLQRVTLDDLQLAGCDFLKIDAEGMEWNCLRGGARTVAEHRPVIYFEQVGDRNWSAIRELLTELGYELFVHDALAFNKNNFNGLSLDLFAGKAERSILGLHRGERRGRDVIDEIGLPLVRDLAEFGRSQVFELPEDLYRGTVLESKRPASGFQSDRRIEDLTLVSSGEWCGMEFALDAGVDPSRFACSLEYRLQGSPGVWDFQALLYRPPWDGRNYAWLTLGWRREDMPESDPYWKRLRCAIDSFVTVGDLKAHACSALMLRFRSDSRAQLCIRKLRW